MTIMERESALGVNGYVNVNIFMFKVDIKFKDAERER